MRKLKELDKVDFAFKNSIENYEKNEQTGLQELTLKDGTKIETQLIVGSDGRNSKVKDLGKNFNTYGWMYH